MRSIKDNLQTEERQNRSTELPHFSRFISAGRRQAVNFSLKFLVFALILTFFVVNFVGAHNCVPHGVHSCEPLQSKIDLLVLPTNPDNYKILADEFLKNHDLQTATYFNDLGLSLFPTSLPLLKQKDEIYYLANEPRFLAEEIPVWKNIVNHYPDYRDGYARLLWLNLKLGRTADAKKYLETIKTLDPNWLPLERINL